MKVWEEALEDLRAGKSVKEVQKKYRSQSQIYLAIRIHSEEIQKEMRETELKLARAETKLADVRKKIGVAKQEKTGVDEEVQKLETEKENFTQDLNTIKEEINQLKTEIEKYRTFGYSKEIFQEIGQIEARSGRKLLRQLKTLVKSNQLKKALHALQRRLKIAERELQEIQAKKTETKKAVISEGNRLDQLKMEIAVLKGFVEIVKAFIRDGYTEEDLKLLKICLDNLQVKDDPKLSISRLAKGLQMEKSLTILKDKVENERKNLTKIRKARADAEDETEILKKTSIDAIETTRNAGVEAIGKIAENTNRAMLGAAKEFSTALERGEDNIQRIAEACRDGLEEYSNLQQEAGRLKQEIHYGKVLFGVLNSTDYLKTLPPTLVAEILNRVALWTRSNYPEFTVSPSPTVTQKENKLIAIWKYNLAALVEFAAEGLRNLIRELVEGGSGA